MIIFIFHYFPSNQPNGCLPLVCDMPRQVHCARILYKLYFIRYYRYAICLCYLSMYGSMAMSGAYCAWLLCQVLYVLVL